MRKLQDLDWELTDNDEWRVELAKVASQIQEREQPQNVTTGFNVSWLDILVLSS